MIIYLPRLTVLVAALVAFGALLAGCGPAAFWAVIAFSLLVGCVCIISADRRRLSWLALLPIVSFLYAQWRAPHPGNRDLAHYIGRQVVVKARVCDPAAGFTARRLRLVIAPSQMLFPDVRPLSGRAELVVDGDRGPGASYGDTLKITGFVTNPIKQNFAWQTDAASLLAKQSIYCVVTAYDDGVHIEESVSDQCVWSEAEKAIDAVRDRIRSIHVANLGSEAGSLLTSMVLGERAVEVAASIKSAFRTVGLSHIIAASGFNLTVVTAISYWLARFITRSKLIMTIFAMASMFLFVLLAGLSASVLRAALMCSLVLLARHAGRSLHAMAALGFALLLTLLIEPTSIADAGCQLSYAATAGIICGADSLARIVSLDSMPKLLRSGIAAAAVVIAAQLAIIPIQVYYFWQIGLLFLPANLTVSVLVSPVTILGFASSLFAAFPSEQTIITRVVWALDALAAYPLKAIIIVADYFASFKAAVITLGPPSLASIVIYYLGLASLFVSLRHKRHRVLCLLIFCLATSLLFWRSETSQLSAAVLPRSIAFFGSNRNGFALGERTKQLERFLAFNGVHPNVRPTAGKLGKYFFDEYLIQSSKCDFALVLPRQWEKQDGALVDQAADRITPELELPSCRDSGKRLVRIAVLQAAFDKEGAALPRTDLVASLKEHGAADWILMIQTDRSTGWSEMVYTLSLEEGMPTMIHKAAPAPGLALFSLTLCPHRKVTILPVEPAIYQHHR